MALALRGLAILVAGLTTLSALTTQSLARNGDGATMQGVDELVTGNHRWLFLLCRTSDRSDYTPQEPSYYAKFNQGGFPSLDDYWNEVSYGNLRIGPGGVSGWHNLPFPESYYKPGGNLFGTTAKGTTGQYQIREDCMQAADSYVNFANYDGHSFCL